MNNNILVQLNKLTFKELKTELKKNNDPMKEKIIRQLMKNKYIKYINYKKSINDCELNDDDFAQPLPNKIKTLNELDDNFVNCSSGAINDKKFDTEIKRDQVNNNLMDRLNSDLYIKDIMKPIKKYPTGYSPNKMPLTKPYEEVLNNQSFTPFNNSNIIPNNDFSNKRLINK